MSPSQKKICIVQSLAFCAGWQCQPSEFDGAICWISKIWRLNVLYPQNLTPSMANPKFSAGWHCHPAHSEILHVHWLWQWFFSTFKGIPLKCPCRTHFFWPPHTSNSGSFAEAANLPLAGSGGKHKNKSPKKPDLVFKGFIPSKNNQPWSLAYCFLLWGNAIPAYNELLLWSTELWRFCMSNMHC